MDCAQSLSHTKWDCKYHVVWIPKCRQKVLYGKIRQHLADLLKDLAKQQGCEILEGHLRPNHIHILITIPPKLSVSKVLGYIKGKSAIAIARTYVGRRIAGQSFWAGATMSAR
jgi:putative transposase